MDGSTLEGVWRPIRAESAGELAPPEALEKIRLILAGGQYRFELDGEETDAGLCTVAPSATGGCLELRASRGLNAGRHIPAIFQTRGDLLRICFGMDGTPPNEFTAPSGSTRYLATYRRANANLAQ